MSINLYFSCGKASIWNAEDWEKLRKHHRIVGELIGTIAPFPRHSGFHGFPMMLMTEEAMLLVEKGICQIVEIENLNELPSDEIVKAAEEMDKK